jgi:preprotein translocase subunit SecE
VQGTESRKMSNQSVQTVSTSSDKIKVALAIVAAIAGVVGFYYLAGQPALVRASALVAGLVIAVALLYVSTTGREFLNLAKEATQITAIVFAFVLVMAIFLWGTDKLLEFLLYDVILGWKK